MNRLKLAVFGLGLSGSLLGATATVQIPGMRFVPEKVVIQAGDSVEFVNATRGVHTVTADPALVKDLNNILLPAGATPFHSGALRPGDRFTQKFEVTGLYQYVCLPHEGHGMIGQVEVLPVPSED